MIPQRLVCTCCAGFFALLSGCGIESEPADRFSGLTDTLSSVKASLAGLNERIEALGQQVAGTRDKDTRPDANATTLAGQCQASLLATSLVFADVEEQAASRSPESEQKDQVLVEQWLQRYRIDRSTHEAASAAAIRRFLEKHRTFGVTESAADDALRTEELNRLHDACEAMRLVPGEPAESRSG